ncbi:MAG: hypothetical protein JWM56_504, partial [Candidatus Peribacteria bacterium]|nr:hypothetical protein [Candidatus Peribacteria bacterium]
YDACPGTELGFENLAGINKIIQMHAVKA